MKTLITWLYRKYVFMPELLSYKHPKQQYEFLCWHDVLLCDDTEILRNILEERDNDGNPGLRLVE